MDTAHNINQNPAYRHTPLTETDLNPDEDTIPLIRAVCVCSTRNPELLGPDLSLGGSIIYIPVWEPDTGPNMIL